jgi:hypothetical protein
MEGLPSKIPDSCRMFLLERTTMLKAKKRSAKLGHYVRKVLRANELSYMAVLQKDYPSYLTMVIENIFEVAIILAHLQDDAAVKAKRPTMSSIEVKEHARAIHQTTYYQGCAMNF